MTHADVDDGRVLDDCIHQHRIPAPRYVRVGGIMSSPALCAGCVADTVRQTTNVIRRPRSPPASE
jgi:hypothetical protein